MVIMMRTNCYLMLFFYLDFVIAACTNVNLVALGVINIVITVIYN